MVGEDARTNCSGFSSNGWWFRLKWEKMRRLCVVDEQFVDNRNEWRVGMVGVRENRGLETGGEKFEKV